MKQLWTPTNRDDNQQIHDGYQQNRDENQQNRDEH